MAPSAKSRKGKKAWRRNIDDTAERKLVETRNMETIRGPGVRGLGDSELFFVDKTGAGDAHSTKLSRAARRAEASQRPLRSALVLSECGAGARPVPRPPPPRKRAQPAAAQGSQAKRTRTGGYSKPGVAANGLTDLWGDDGEPAGDEWEAAAGAILKPRPVKLERNRKKVYAPLTTVPAVVLDPAGCAINPDVNLHQDAVALAVAVEVKLADKREAAAAAAVPALVPRDDAGPPLDALTALQVEEEADDEVDGQVAEAGAGAQHEGIADGGAVRVRQRAERRAKRKALRSKLRQRDEAATAAARAALKRQRRDLDALRSLAATISAEEQEQALRAQRKQVKQAELRAVQPPRLGPGKYKAASLQVLTSDELGSSLRRLRPCVSLVSHRFNSLQQRGLVPASRGRAVRRVSRRIEFQTGDRFDRAVAAQEELRELQKATKKLRRKVGQAAEES